MQRTQSEMWCWWTHGQADIATKATTSARGSNSNASLGRKCSGPPIKCVLDNRLAGVLWLVELQVQYRVSSLQAKNVGSEALAVHAVLA